MKSSHLPPSSWAPPALVGGAWHTSLLTQWSSWGWGRQESTEPALSLQGRTDRWTSVLHVPARHSQSDPAKHQEDDGYAHQAQCHGDEAAQRTCPSPQGQTSPPAVDKPQAKPGTGHTVGPGGAPPQGSLMTTLSRPAPCGCQRAESCQRSGTAKKPQPPGRE